MKCRPIFILTLVALAIPFAWVLWWRYAPSLLTEDYTKAGVFGDMFGALNTLFTGFAFVGLVYTILQQREQLALAKEELAEARTTTKLQRFEGTFFQLLALLTGIVESMARYWNPGGDQGYLKKQGRDALYLLADELLKSIKHQQTEMELPQRREFLAQHYGTFYERRSTQLAHYFRVLYRILTLIHSADIPDKHHYAKILRAQMSGQELLLLFYNSFIPEGHNMRKYVDEYALLKHVPLQFLALPKDRDLYDECAYKDKPA
jgi:hypothetical protein